MKKGYFISGLFKHTFVHEYYLINLHKFNKLELKNM